MKRSLILSELEIIRCLCPTVAIERLSGEVVNSESLSPPQSGATSQQWFNTDFMLMFCSSLPPRVQRSVVAFPAKPGTIGSEVFLVTDLTGMPAMLELLEGESIPKEEYKDDLTIIENYVIHTKCDGWHGKVGFAPFLRIIDLGDRVTFLAATTVRISPWALSLIDRFDSDDVTMNLHSDGKDSAIEGVIYR